MSKPYPPQINGTIPAFYGTTLVVPFSMNRAVSQPSISGMQLKLKTVQNSTYIIDDQIIDLSHISFDPYCQAVFNLKQEDISKLKIGQYYKIQIAYRNENDETGFFSNIGVVKYTAQPEVTIEDLTFGESSINMHRYEYVGKYYQSKETGDISERVYSYCFNLYDNSMNLIQTSGDKIHDSSMDTELNESRDVYTIEQDLELNKSYYLEYLVTTLNGLRISSKRYRIMQKSSINPEIKVDLKTVLDYENGIVLLKLEGQKSPDNVEYAASGAFKIVRSSSVDNFQSWHEILRFTLHGQQPSYWSWKDFTVQQGVIYKYALQQYNDKGLNSNRLEAEPLFVDFEHMFLFDGKRQLKVKYNPKVSSFKNNILESKIETIGGKYPYIFRNGNIKYKEFSLSGLISCLSDEDFLFTEQENLELHDNSANLIGENTSVERKFKLDVLEWLNNGQPKLFRSPAEGNYIVRLLNISLSPNDTLGRMLHTFNATAYEIAENTYYNLNELDLISIKDPIDKQLRWESITLDKIYKRDENILNYKAVSLYFEGMLPGEILYINDGIYRDGNTIPGYEVTIGATGSYIIDLSTGIEVSEIKFVSGPKDFLEESAGLGVYHQGTLTYAYYSRIQNRFDSITDVIIQDCPLEQYIGKQENIIEAIENVKTKIYNFNYIHCSLRDIQNAYYKTEDEENRKYYKTLDCKEELEYDSYVLYKVHYVEENKVPEAKYYLDGHSLIRYELDEYSSSFEINGSLVDLAEIKEYSIKKPEDIKSFKLGSGVIAEISYHKQIIEFSVESDSKKYLDLVNSKASMLQAYDDLRNHIKIEDGEELEEKEFKEKEQEKRIAYKTAYDNFIKKLEEVLKAEEEAQGDVPK